MPKDSLSQLTKKVISFRDERDWEQFHSAKNCAASIAVEAGELLEHYRWSEKPDNKDAADQEAADLLYALLLYCHAAKIDVGQKLLEKLDEIGQKYPVEKVKGKHHKYTHYQE